MKKLLFCIAFLLGLLNISFAQSPNKYLSEPQVGKPCPNFVLNKIDFYKSKKVSLSDLKGKWVVLDFWSRFCSGCIASFPTINKEQEQFGDSVQFVMIAPDSSTGERQIYSNYQSKLNLSMPSAFDSEIGRAFNVGQLPHTIIIDPNGIVRAVTVSPEATKLIELMKGKNPKFSAASYANRKDNLERFSYDWKVPYLVNGNGGVDSDFLFRSLLTQWKPSNPTFRNGSMLQFQKYLANGGRFELISVSVDVLYQAAYSGRRVFGVDDTTLYGKFSPVPIFKIKDSSSLHHDGATGKNLYCYSLSVPVNKANESDMMQIMQSDLKNYFGYEVAVETQRMPYWRLTATEAARMKLKTKGGTFSINSPKPWQETNFRNSPIKELIRIIAWYSGIDATPAPLLDETGILSNIDIDLDWAKGDFDVCRKALQKNGLDLIQGEKEMKVIVVRDPKPTGN